MLRKIMLGLLLAALTAGAAADTVYKWMDSRGQVHYTDLPPQQSDARVLDVYERSTTYSEEPAAADSSSAGAASTPPAADPSRDAADRAATAAVNADLEKSRGDQCKQAQERYKLYIESQRLFKKTPDGGRAYLTDAELAQERINAKQAVDEYCK